MKTPERSMELTNITLAPKMFANYKKQHNIPRAILLFTLSAFHLKNEEAVKFSEWLSDVKSQANGDRIIFAVEKKSQLPECLASFFSIPLPELTHEELDQQLGRSLQGIKLSTDEMDVSVRMLSRSGLLLNQIPPMLGVVAKRVADKSEANIESAIKSYLSGFAYNPWCAESMKVAINKIETSFDKEISGQSEAKLKILSAMKRSYVIGSATSEPPLVLFLSGPSGTGKTATSKLIARGVFGSADNVIYINCAELSQPHESAKLTGAAAGYIGYGEDTLLSPLKRNPASVVLFDEIEKANPMIFKQLLSILAESKITDAKGDIISFAQAAIVFTSNLGISDLSPNMTYPEIQKTIRDAVEAYFRSINSVEVLGRLGGPNAIICYDFIRDEASVSARYLEGVLKKIEASRKTTITLKKNFIENMLKQLNRNAAILYGARGFHEEIKKLVLDPLSSYLFDINCSGKRIELGFETGLVLPANRNVSGH